MKAASILVILLLSLVTFGCKDETPDQASDNTGATEAVDFKVDNSIELKGEPVTVAGVTFTPPAEWKSMPASGMRQAVYTYGPVEGESDSATMVVFYFGQEGGGGVQANIDRWIGQISTPEGGDVAESAQHSMFTVDGMQAHYVDVIGTYNASMGGGGMPGGPSHPLENYRLAGIVLEGPQGNLFFKLTGPQKAAAQMIEGFKAMLMKAKKAA